MNSHRFEFLARVLRDRLTGTIQLQLIQDPDVVELVGGDEFVTVRLAVDPFDRPEGER